MTPEGGRPLDALLFDVVRVHSLRTCGQQAKSVTVEYADGTSATLPLPSEVHAAPTPARSEAVPWPPDEGWAFRPGEVAFDGTRFKLGGKMLGILRELARVPGNPVATDRLKREVWGEEPDLIDDANLQGHVSLLRKKIRDALGLDRGFDPIPNADGAYRLAIH